MKGRNGAAEPASKSPARSSSKVPAKVPAKAPARPPVETFGRFVRQLARLESERVKGGEGEASR
ncbi:hypothetical protein [Bosea sp. (in: a-proteobacteria)]|uniref:hypothetical protein n=1 Tax=Bosea sp. (in: a-proteobacteria) TaxID=1871050 RepID=UPI002605081B|nr:hypothetical protein [Bosea sp. (in: a-proteobacteria)]MCO5092542.1 hypothetical protein [Bosea sp. (in: a-proteobacteria)]